MDDSLGHYLTFETSSLTGNGTYTFPPPSNGILLSNVTGTLTILQGSAGQLLTSGGIGAPTFTSSISGLTINNSTIGSSTASTGRFTSLSTTTGGLDLNANGITNLGALSGVTSISGSGDITASAGSNWIFRTNGTERARITSAGNIGVGTNAPNSTALVDFSSTSLGVLVPRMTRAQRLAISSPGTGLLVYQTDSIDTRRPSGFYFYTGSTWIDLLSLQSGWGINGNTGTNPTTNFIGTADSQALVVRTNDTERARVLATGEVGIGTSTPATKLEVKNGDVSLTNSGSAGALRLYSPSSSGSNYNSFSSRAQSTTLNYTLPDTAGHAGNLLANDGNGNLYWTSNVTIGSLNLGISTTITVGGTRNNQVIDPSASVVRVLPTSAVTFTGLSGGSDGRVVIMYNVAASSTNVTLSNENSNSDAANRFTLNSNTLNLSPGQSVSLIYDGTSSRWRPFASF